MGCLPLLGFPDEVRPSIRTDAYCGGVAMISMHTSPLQQPGSGDAGGMNVYVLNTARGWRGRA